LLLQQAIWILGPNTSRAPLILDPAPVVAMGVETAGHTKLSLTAK